MSIAQLPVEVLVEVVSFTRDILRDDLYLSDLRLVSRQFNEVILHVLICRPVIKPRPNSPQQQGHCNPFSSVNDWIGLNQKNPAYLRMHLQAQLGSSLISSVKLSRDWHCSLRAAVAQLKFLFDQTHLGEARRLLEDDPRFYVTSKNPFFTDKVTSLVCSAAVAVIDLADPFFYRGYKTNRAYELYHAPVSFWVIITAYYLGNLPLLEFLLEEVVFMQILAQSKFGSLTRCLRVAARQGHGHIIEYVVLKTHATNASCDDKSKRIRYNSTLVLRETWFAGLTHVAKQMISLHPPEETISFCKDTLCKLQTYQSPRALSSPIFDLVLDYARPLDHAIVGTILAALVEHGLVDQLKTMLKREGGHWIYSETQDWRRESLWNVAARTNVECQLILAESGLCAMHSQRDKLLHPLKGYPAYPAIDQDRIDIAERLCNFAGIDLYSTRLDDKVTTAAGVKGGLRILETMTLRNPNFWRAETYLAANALKRAIAKLQPNNVRYLLEHEVQYLERDGPVRIQWRYRRTREDRYQAVQSLLKEYSVRPIEMLTPPVVR